MSQEDWERLADAEFSHDSDTARAEVAHAVAVRWTDAVTFPQLPPKRS